MTKRLKSRFAHFRELEPWQVARPHFRFRNPVVEGMLELITQAIYDYYEVALATAVTTQRLFSIPIGGAYTPSGGAVFNKNRFHTNLEQAGMLSQPCKHLTRAVAVYFCGDITPNDLNRFLHNTLLTFELTRKPYLEMQVGKLPGGGGGWGVSTQNNIGVLSNGSPDARNLYCFDEDKAVQIEAGQNFDVILDPLQVQGGAFVTDTAAAVPAGMGIRCHVYLEGDLARQVQ